MINHSKDVLEETYDLWDYFDEKRDALERLERYFHGLRAMRAKRYDERLTQTFVSRLDADLDTKVNVQLQALKRFPGLIKHAAYEAHEGRTPPTYLVTVPRTSTHKRRAQ